MHTYISKPTPYIRMTILLHILIHLHVQKNLVKSRLKNVHSFDMTTEDLTYKHFQSDSTNNPIILHTINDIT